MKDQNSEVERKNLVYISGNIRDGLGLKIWQGILKKTREIDANLICYVGGDLGEDNSSLVYNLINVEKMDGFLSHAASERDMHLLYYDKFRNRPFIALSLPIPGFPVVMTDSYDSMKKMVEHLITEHSYTKIAFARGPENHIYAEQRYKAYIDVVRENDILDQKLITPPLLFDDISGEEAVRILLDERNLKPVEDIEAIVFVSDTPAVNAVHELTNRNIKIPDEIAITGFNDQKEAHCTTPPMTTVRLPFAEQGSKAMDLLIKLIDKEHIATKTILPAKLIIAQSCGCLPADGKNIIVQRETQKKIVKSKKVFLENITNELTKLAKDNNSGTEIAEYSEILVKTFIEDIEGTGHGKFLRCLNELLTKVRNIDNEIISLQNSIFTIRNSLSSYTKDRILTNAAENLWNQARVTLSEFLIRANEREHLKRMRLEETLRNISTKLITSYNMNKLLEILSESLSELNIPGCYISLFEDPGSITSLFDPPEHAQIIFAYENGKRKNLKEEGLIYPSKELLPKGHFESNEQKILIVHSLNYNATQIGFVVFELGPEEGFIYFALGKLLSSALENKYTAFLEMLDNENEVSTETILRPYKNDTAAEQESDARYFYANLNPDSMKSDFVLYGGMEKHDLNNVNNRNMENSYCLEIVIGGKGEIEVDGNTYSLFPGFTYIVGPPVKYAIKSDHLNPLQKYFVVFQGENFLKVLKGNGYSIGDVIQLSNLNDIVDLVEVLFKETSRKRPFCDDINTELLYLIIYKILESRVSENIFINIYSERFQKCKTYIDKNYLKIHTMDDIVEDLSIQKTYICRLFKMFDHESPYQYLLRKKMNHAYDMLTNTNTLIRIIASEIGFEDPYHFSKVFKKMFMMSPREVRQLSA